MRPHKKLVVWQETVKLIKEVYFYTSKFPRDEVFVIVPQMRRAVISIASNIAEGSAYTSKKEKIRFFTIARASLSELDAQTEIALELAFLSAESGKLLFNRVEPISRMLQGLINNCKE